MRCTAFRHDRIFATRAVLLIALLSLVQSGCAGLLYQMNSERKKKVPAECDKLAGRKVAIVVWAELSTLDEDYQACSRTAESIAYYLRQNTAKRQLRGTTFVDYHTVNDLQEQVGNLGPSLPNNEVATRLNADTILRVDLYEYTTRAPDAQGLKMGRISANITVFNRDEESPVYRTEASASFPEDSRIGVLDLSDRQVLDATMATFAERVARKFYDHEVAYE